MKTFDEAAKDHFTTTDFTLLSANYKSYLEEHMENELFTSFIAQITINFLRDFLSDKQDPLTITSATLHIVFVTGMLIGQKMEQRD